MTVAVFVFDRLSDIPCALADEELTSSEADPPKSIEEELADKLMREKVEAAEAKAREAVKKSQASGETVLRSVAKLQARLKEMKALLAEQGEDADPALRERVETLESSIKDIEEEFGEDSLDDLSRLITGCFHMGAARADIRQESTLLDLRFLAESDDMTSIWAQASQLELWRMIGSCIAGFSEEEIQQYKAGTLTELPEKYATISIAKAQVALASIDVTIWRQLQSISVGLLKNLNPEFTTDDPKVARVPLEPPMMSYGFVAMIPLVLAVLFMGKLFRDMQQRQNEKKKKKEKRDARKSR